VSHEFSVPYADRFNGPPNFRRSRQPPHRGDGTAQEHFALPDKDITTGGLPETDEHAGELRSLPVLTEVETILVKTEGGEPDGKKKGAKARAPRVTAKKVTAVTRRKNGRMGVGDGSSSCDPKDPPTKKTEAVEGADEKPTLPPLKAIRRRGAKQKGSAFETPVGTMPVENNESQMEVRTESSTKKGTSRSIGRVASAGKEGEAVPVVRREGLRARKKLAL
jgi:hypothetical protein